MRRFVSRLLSAKLAAAWNQWTSAADQFNMLAGFGARMLQRDLLKGWNKWYAQLEQYWRLQEIGNRMLHVGLARGFDQWVATLESRSKVNKRQQGYMRYQALRKLTRAWRVWTTNAHEQIARGRIRDTFRFSKAPDEEMHAEAVDWRAALNKGRTQ